jgi:hypothetical protein
MSYASNLDKESIYELQKIDCNCNDCGYLIRDKAKFEEAQRIRKQIQLDYYNLMREKALVKANEIEDEKVKEQEIKLINKKSFQYSAPHPQINYGTCSNKKSKFLFVNFLPTTFMQETQECFVHRKDL